MHKLTTHSDHMSTKLTTGNYKCTHRLFDQWDMVSRPTADILHETHCSSSYAPHPAQIGLQSEEQGGIALAWPMVLLLSGKGWCCGVLRRCSCAGPALPSVPPSRSSTFFLFLLCSQGVMVMAEKQIHPNIPV